MNGAVYNIELRRGEKVAMLFTPRLYMYKGQEGITLECDARNQIEVFSMYADLMYCAALNHWTLTHSADEEFPYTRVDFHALSVSNRDAFYKAMVFAMQTLSGKSMKELIAEAGNAQETQGNEQKEGEAKDVKKKSLFGSITTRLRRIWSAIVD
jgi:hypothetical protein